MFKFDFYFYNFNFGRRNSKIANIYTKNKLFNVICHKNVKYSNACHITRTNNSNILLKKYSNSYYKYRLHYERTPNYLSNRIRHADAIAVIEYDCRFLSSLWTFPRYSVKNGVHCPCTYYPLSTNAK